MLGGVTFETIRRQEIEVQNKETVCEAALVLPTCYLTY